VFAPREWLERLAPALENTTKNTRGRATIEAPENCIFLCVFGGGTISGKHDPWKAWGLCVG